jgi:hypothetical protein
LGETGLRVYLFERTPGGTLYREVYIGGKRVASKKSLAHRDKDRAEAEVYTLLAKLKAREEALTEGKLTLSMLFDMYLGSPAFAAKQRRTRRADKGKMRRFLQFFGADRDVTTLSQTDVELYEEARRRGWNGLSPVRARAVAADLSLLRAALNWATRQRDARGHPVLDRNPLTGVAFPVEKNPRQPVADQERYERTLKVAPLVHPFLATILVLSNEAGHRNGSVRTLRRTDLHLESYPGSTTWRADDDKEGYEWERTPISVQARRAIDAHLREHPEIEDGYLFPSPRRPGQPYCRTAVRAWLLKAEALAGLPKLEGGLWHPYRRKFATELLEVPDRVVARLGGWKCTRTLDLYQQPSQDVLAEAFEKRRALRAAHS